MAETEPIASLEHVGVRYGKQWALSDVSAAFPAGAVGLLGPNGAGKSTLLKALLGLLKPDTGSSRVLGIDVASRPLEVRARIGYMPESDAQIPGMTAVSFVAYCAELSGLRAADAMQRAHEVLFYVGLGEARYRNVETYSTGMKQRIKLAQALVHDPDVLFLDEPTNGMDPKGREDMLALVRDIAQKKQISLILSSHVMPDVESVCDAVVLMNRGKIVMQGPIDALKRPAGHLFEVRVKGDQQAFVEAIRLRAFECREIEGGLLRIVLPAEAGPVELFASAVKAGVQVRHLKPSLPTLEDVFAQAMGEE
ncbi:MAG: ABC transporter ATP-binding protein [Vicinamibacterales bacterium]|nr:ABC transporter ATP-binding protein [Vicinamibacterales bacterium]